MLLIKPNVKVYEPCSRTRCNGVDALDKSLLQTYTRMSWTWLCSGRLKCSATGNPLPMAAGFLFENPPPNAGCSPKRSASASTSFANVQLVTPVFSGGSDDRSSHCRSFKKGLCHYFLVRRIVKQLRVAIGAS